MSKVSDPSASSRQDFGRFWNRNQPGFRFASAPVSSPEFFAEVERQRYELESHIPDIVQFERWSGRDVLEIGCGIATDGVQFARVGARYVGLDANETPLRLGRRRFEQEGLEGHFARGSASRLPFDDASFDLVYCHGVLHHIPDTEAAVADIHRVLRPDGVVLVMLYHRNSINYRFTIMVVRRLFALTMLSQHGRALASRITGEETGLLEGHRALLRQHGLRYLIDKQLFLSNNTDGPGNPLSKVYSRREAELLFREFADVKTTIRFPNLRIYPAGERIERAPMGRRVGQRLGWHLYVAARRGG